MDDVVKRVVDAVFKEIADVVEKLEDEPKITVGMLRKHMCIKLGIPAFLPDDAVLVQESIDTGPITFVAPRPAEYIEFTFKKAKSS